MQQISRLSNLARVVYGIVLPACLLYLALISHFNMVRDREILAWQEEMNASLDRPGKFFADDKFFHGLLQTNFRQVSRSTQPIEVITRKIAALKQKFPNLLRFIVWDKNGRVIQKLSDEKQFQYVIRTMYQAINALDKQLSQAITPIPEKMSVITNRISLLRGYFGQFLMEKHMVLPLLDGYLGSCIRASEDKSKGLLWYQIYDDFGVICFVDSAACDRELGIKMLIDQFNATSKTIKLGYFDTQNLSLYGNISNTSAETELTMEVNRFFNSAVEFRQTSNWLLLLRQVSPGLIIFSRLAINDHLAEPQHRVKLIMFKLAQYALVALFAAYCFLLRHRRLYFSVKEKMLLLFLFANGLPLMILGATGYEFFEQKKQSLIHETHQQSARIIKEFDNFYPAGREATARHLREFIAKTNQRFGDQKWPPEQIEELQKIIHHLNPSESYLFGTDGEQTFALGKESLTSSVRVIKQFFGGVLQFFNNTKPYFNRKSSNVLESISDEVLLYNGILNQLGGIEQQNYGSGMRWTYLDLLGDRKNNKSWGILLVAWSSDKLQRTFLQQRLSEINDKISPRRLIVMEKGSEKLFPEDRRYSDNIRKIMHRTQTRKIIMDDNLQIDNKGFIATTLTGIELADAIVMAVYPRDITLQAVDRIFVRVIVAAFWSIILVLIIVWFFSARMLAPVRGLADGVKAISRRDFKFRVDYAAEDEFGQLIKVFNEAVEGMEELAIGTAVQNSLLPSSNSQLACCSLFARSIFMSKMGGDYYDYFKLDEQRLAVFFGDVAGHGIPAALVMAMAKGVITTTRPDYTGPAELLSRVNSIFLHLKEKGWRRMMTGLSLELNCVTGEFKLANAGQCYPVIVDRQRRAVTYIKAAGLPLGSVMRKPHVEVTGQLAPGDTLILYTDGIIEATNSNDEVFDFSRFEKLLLASWHDDLETYWSGIFKGYSAWASVQDDDITFLMVKYEPD